MEKITISTTYDVKFWISETHCLTICGKVINTKRGVEVKLFLRGRHKAVYVYGVAHFIDDLKPIERNKCPF